MSRQAAAAAAAAADDPKSSGMRSGEDNIWYGNLAASNSASASLLPKIAIHKQANYVSLSLGLADDCNSYSQSDQN